jgi:hypothetical protein
MEEEFYNLKEEPKEFKDFNNLKLLNLKPLYYYITNTVFKKLLFWKPFKKWIFKRKGLTKSQANTFVNGEY